MVRKTRFYLSTNVIYLWKDVKTAEKSLLFGDLGIVSNLLLLLLAIRSGEDRCELLENTLLKLRVDQKGNFIRALQMYKIFISLRTKC